MPDTKYAVKPGATRQSTRFYADDADIYFESADNVRFGVHRKNLEVTTGAFPPSDLPTYGEVVRLSESSKTLDLLFQYIYPMTQPNISLLPFDTLAPLAEAAEKYQVFPAMFVCKIHMKKFTPTHGQEILTYAAKHGYSDLVGESAHILLAMPLEKALSQLPGNLVVPWALYHSAWDSVLCLARSFHSDPLFERLASGQHARAVNVVSVGAFGITQSCVKIDKVLCDVMKKLDDVQSLRNLTYVFQSDSACEHATPILDSWRKRIEGEVGAIKSLSAYVLQVRMFTHT